MVCLSLVALCSPMPAVANGPEPPTCLGFTQAQWQAMGYTVIVSNAATINGDWRKNVIIGGSSANTINAGNGDDVVCGGDGDDIIRGGTGHDVLVGEGGSDTIYGETGNDFLIGDRVADDGPALAPSQTPHGPGWYCGACESNWYGDDVYLFGRRYVQVEDGAGDDYLNTAEGGAGAPVNVGEWMYGGAGNDVLIDTDGDTLAEGGSGNDWIELGPGNDSADCGDGTDVADGGLHQGGTDPVSGLSAIDIAEANCETVVNVP